MSHKVAPKPVNIHSARVQDGSLQISKNRREEGTSSTKDSTALGQAGMVHQRNEFEVSNGTESTLIDAKPLAARTPSGAHSSTGNQTSVLSYMLQGSGRSEGQVSGTDTSSSTDPVQANLEAFRENFTEADALKLSELWDIDIQDARTQLGHQVLQGNKEEMVALLSGESSTITPDFSNGIEDTSLSTEDVVQANLEAFRENFTEADAQKLSELWDIDIVDARTQLGHQVRKGNRDEIVALLNGEPSTIVPNF